MYFRVTGYIYNEMRRAVNVLVHTDQTYEIYQQFCYPKKVRQVTNRTIFIFTCVSELCSCTLRQSV